MKKWLTVLMTMMLTIGMVACTDKAQPTDGQNEQENAETDHEAQNDEANEVSDEEGSEDDQAKEDQDDLTAEEIYKKVVETSAEIESAEISLVMEQNIEVPSEDFTMETDSDFTMEMTMDPLAFYQNGTTTAAADGETEEMMQEMYMADEGIFFYVEEEDTWVKMDDSMFSELNLMEGLEVDPTDQLEIMEQFVDELDFEETDDEYILQLKADGVELTSLVADYIEGFLPEGLEESPENLEDIIEINDMYQEIIVDKESFDMLGFNMEMDMVIENDGEKMNIGQNTTAEYSKVDEIDKIEVPQDVIDSAIDADEIGLE
ncbi:MAG TPA: DUF6612 family protein [Bacillota bacterium]|nr:DUF6612 family protein [Bacillota bacterium]